MNYKRYRIFKNDPYTDNLSLSIDKVLDLVDKKNISPQLATELLHYLLAKNTNIMVKNYVNQLFHDKKIERTLLINYQTKKTNYLI